MNAGIKVWHKAWLYSIMTSSRARPHISALLIDLSGTLHIDKMPTKNSKEALQKLRLANIPFRFCSNTSKESTESLYHRLSAMGFNPDMDSKREIWTSLGALKSRLKVDGLTRPFFLLSESAMSEFSDMIPKCSAIEDYDSVVVGLAPQKFNYETLNKAFRILTMDSIRHEAKKAQIYKPPLLTTHRAKYFASSEGTLSLGPGPFVAALEMAASVQAQSVGKPSKDFFETVMADFSDSEKLGRGPEGWNGKIAIIGDDVEADLGEGAIELGLWRVLVKTGKYRAGDEHRPGTTSPDEVFESFAHFVDSLLNTS